MKLTIELPKDSEGFVDYGCPFCGKRFRLPINALQNDKINKLYCPYCGLYSEPQRFATEELQQLIKETAAQFMQEKLDKSFSKLARNSKGIIKYKPGKKIEPQKVILDEMFSNRIHCDKCDMDVKIDDSVVLLHTCPLCGEKIG